MILATDDRFLKPQKENGRKMLRGMRTTSVLDLSATKCHSVELSGPASGRPGSYPIKQKECDLHVSFQLGEVGNSRGVKGGIRIIFPLLTFSLKAEEPTWFFPRQRKLSPSGGMIRNGGIIQNGGWRSRTTVYMPTVNDFCRFFVLRKPRTKLLNFFIHVSFLPKDSPG